jgi:nucleoside 2-deoxyribosyltransferase
VAAETKEDAKEAARANPDCTNPDDCKNVDPCAYEITTVADKDGNAFRPILLPQYKLAVTVPESCYKEFGSDLDSCSRQESQGCQGCRVLREAKSGKLQAVSHVADLKHQLFEQFEGHSAEVKAIMPALCDYQKVENENRKLQQDLTCRSEQYRQAIGLIQVQREEIAAKDARFVAPIVCLCGSTRFKQTWIAENARLTGEGNIVLAVGLWGHHERQYPDEATKAFLDALHKRKIDLCDWVWVLDVNGYIGDSTRSEIDYAVAHGKPVRRLSVEFPEYVEPVDPMVAAIAAKETEIAEIKEELRFSQNNFEKANNFAHELNVMLIAEEEEIARLQTSLAAEHRNDDLPLPFTDREMTALRHARERRLKCGGGCACDMCSQVIEMLKGGD